MALGALARLRPVRPPLLGTLAQASRLLIKGHQRGPRGKMAQRPPLSQVDMPFEIKEQYGLRGFAHASSKLLAQQLLERGHIGERALLPPSDNVAVKDAACTIIGARDVETERACLNGLSSTPAQRDLQYRGSYSIATACFACRAKQAMPSPLRVPISTRAFPAAYLAMKECTACGERMGGASSGEETTFSQLTLSMWRRALLRARPAPPTPAGDRVAAHTPTVAIAQNRASCFLTNRTIMKHAPNTHARASELHR